MTRLGAAAKRLRDLLGTSGLRWTASLILDRVGVPALGLWPDRTVSLATLRVQVESILRGWGMSGEQVAITVEHLLYADLHGIDTHGCAMLLDYHRGLRAGRLTMTPDVRVLREGPTTALIDGGGGLGHVPADAAMKLAIAKCRETGLGAVAVRNSGHFGAAGAYAAMATAVGLIGVATTNNRTPSVVPTFGVDAMLGTNPIALAAPAKRNRPFLLDMATSTAPVGKLMAAWRAGRRIPRGWAQDPRGGPVTNARRAAGYRRLTPLGSNRTMGGHKGYGLAAAVEILSAVLSGLRTDPAAKVNHRVGHFFLAMDPARFREADGFEDDLDAMMDGLRDCPRVDPRQPVLVAGDPEYAARETRAREGIPLSRAVIEDLRGICRDSAVPFVLDAPGAEAGR